MKNVDIVIVHEFLFVFDAAARHDFEPSSVPLDSGLQKLKPHAHYKDCNEEYGGNRYENEHQIDEKIVGGYRISLIR